MAMVFYFLGSRYTDHILMYLLNGGQNSRNTSRTFSFQLISYLNGKKRNVKNEILVLFFLASIPVLCPKCCSEAMLWSKGENRSLATDIIPEILTQTYFNRPRTCYLPTLGLHFCLCEMGILFIQWGYIMHIV